MAMPTVLHRLPASLLPARRWASKIQAALRTSDSFFAYQALQGVWPAAETAALVGRDEVALPWDQSILDRVRDLDPWTRWRALDLLTFLPDRMLAKVDRAAMQHSLEVRVPLLDHPIVEFLLSVNPKWTRGKSMLRDTGRLLGLPAGPRRKIGFEIPLGAWLRGPLRESIQTLLTGKTVDELGLKRGVIEDHWNAHQQGEADHGERLLAIAVLVNWVEDVLG
jgi:asparagine synthase (glutamine-hydrolysing)